MSQITLHDKIINFTNIYLISYEAFSYYLFNHTNNIIVRNLIVLVFKHIPDRFQNVSRP